MLRKLATSTTWGSLATFCSTVCPSALQAASIRLMVAPTDTRSKKISAPFSLLAWARTTFRLSSMYTLAPSARRPLMCWSMGRGPMTQPPGRASSTSP